MTASLQSRYCNLVAAMIYSYNILYHTLTYYFLFYFRLPKTDVPILETAMPRMSRSST